MTLTLAGINRYPVKSCRGQALEAAAVEKWGLAGDRRWMVIDEQGEQITSREMPRLVLTRPELIAGGLRLSYPDVDGLEVATPSAGEFGPVSVWGNVVSAAFAGDEAGAWFSKILGVPARLVYLDDPTQRHPNPRFTNDDDRVGFADAYPINVATEASLAALNSYIAAGPLAEQGPLPMRRFRPNLVVRDATAWEEDGWRRVRIGSGLFRAVKGCDRCVLTTVDPETATKGKEPIATLARHRRWDGKTWFAMNLVPDSPGVTIAVGDEIEILEAVEAPDGPPR